MNSKNKNHVTTKANPADLIRGIGLEMLNKRLHHLMATKRVAASVALRHYPALCRLAQEAPTRDEQVRRAHQDAIDYFLSFDVFNQAPNCRRAAHRRLVARNQEDKS